MPGEQQRNREGQENEEKTRPDPRPTEKCGPRTLERTRVEPHAQDNGGRVTQSNERRRFERAAERGVGDPRHEGRPRTLDTPRTLGTLGTTVPKGLASCLLAPRPRTFVVDPGVAVIAVSIRRAERNGFVRECDIRKGMEPLVVLDRREVVDAFGRSKHSRAVLHGEEEHTVRPPERAEEMTGAHAIERRTKRVRRHIDHDRSTPRARNGDTKATPFTEASRFDPEPQPRRLSFEDRREGF